MSASLVIIEIFFYSKLCFGQNYMVDICHIDPITSVSNECRMMGKRWYFDVKDGYCRSYISCPVYGNNFADEETCNSACRPKHISGRSIVLPKLAYAPWQLQTMTSWFNYPHACECGSADLTDTTGEGLSNSFKIRKVPSNLESFRKNSNVLII